MLISAPSIRNAHLPFLVTCKSSLIVSMRPFFLFDSFYVCSASCSNRTIVTSHPGTFLIRVSAH